MKTHTAIYLKHFGYDTSEFIRCEICEAKAVDIHHIHPRQKGGNENMDIIENLQALCRQCHIDYGDKVYFKEKIYYIHKARLENFGKPFDNEWINKQIEKYKQLT